MDASSPSFSTLHHYPCHPTPMSSDSQLINSPNDQLYTQGFNPHDAGDDPLLTRTWEALDKLVSASMVGSSSPSLSDLDQKPLSSFYNSPSSTTASSCLLSEHGSVLNNVGLNLASLFSTKPSFVERAAKFSSFSQQVNPAYNIGHTTSSNAKFSHYNHVGMDNGAASNTSSMNAAQLYATASDSAAMALPTACHVVSKTELDVDDVHLDAQKNDPLSSPQLGSDVVSKKKRARSSPKDPVEKKEDCKTSSSHHAVKKAKKVQVQSITSISANVESDHAKGISKQEETLTKPDFVHVRARRGQATDSHSLAERVRREKISERMKYLQDLVPGCTKVTGKAMVLDEIINYVQSLQRQVEFLSMKLASVPPSKLEFNFESLFAKQIVTISSATASRHGWGKRSTSLTPLSPTASSQIRAEQHSMAAQNKHSNASFPLDQAAHGMLMKQDAESNYSYLLHDHQYQLPLQPNSTIYPVKSVPPVNGCLLPAEQSIPSAPHCFVPDCSLRRTGNLLASSSSDTLREGISQITDVWDDDLHTIGANRF